MREFKFRAWDTKNKKFNHELFISNEGLYDIYNDYGGMFSSGLVKEDVSDRFIIQQYTGLKDSEGKEVYEGDIIEFDKPVAPYCMGSDGFESNKLNEVKYGRIIYFAGSFHIECPYHLEEIIEVGQCKVVGNIFNVNIWKNSFEKPVDSDEAVDIIRNEIK